MSTEKQKAANKENAKHSHGPTTEEGLRASALNNFRHGLATKTHEHFGMLFDENPDKFDALLAQLQSEHSPTTETEILLVRHLAEYEWLRARALRFQAECLTRSKIADLPVFIRYQSTHERAFHRTLKELQSLRKEERNTQIGIEAQEHKQAAEILAVEQVNLKKEALNFKREEFVFKKEVFQLKNNRAESKKTQPAPTPAAENIQESSQEGLQQAA